MEPRTSSLRKVYVALAVVVFGGTAAAAMMQSPEPLDRTPTPPPSSVAPSVPVCPCSAVACGKISPVQALRSLAHHGRNDDGSDKPCAIINSDKSVCVKASQVDVLADYLETRGCAASPKY